MAIFNSFLYVYQRVTVFSPIIFLDNPMADMYPTRFSRQDGGVSPGSQRPWKYWMKWNRSQKIWIRWGDSQWGFIDLGTLW